jgi:hypothetical protein
MAPYPIDRILTAFVCAIQRPGIIPSPFAYFGN